MSDNLAPLQPPRHEIVEFDGDQLVAVVLPNDGVAVPVRQLCERIGLDVESQVNRLRRHPVLSGALRMVNVDIGGRVVSVSAIIHHRIPYWLAVVDANEVNVATRPKLVRYQQEIADVLGRLFYGETSAPIESGDTSEVATLRTQYRATLDELRQIREMIIATQRQHDTIAATERGLAEVRQELISLGDIVSELQSMQPVSPRQAEYIQRTIRRLAGRVASARAARTGDAPNEENTYALLFGQFKIDMGIPRYDALPMQRYDQALNWLRAKAAEYLPGDPEALPPLQETLL